MEISSRSSSGTLILGVKGRLDASWTPRLQAEIEECVRRGAHHLGLDLSEVTYLSSAGIRVLLVTAQQLRSIDGSFAIVAASPQILSVLQLSGLEELLSEGGAAAATAPEEARPELRSLPGVALEVFRLGSTSPLDCTLLGEPGLLASSQRPGLEGTALQLGPDAFAVGIGALGEDPHECRQRYGELLAAGGVAASAPTDGADVPDYVISTGTLQPRARLLSGAVCRGGLPLLVRFEASQGGSATLTALVQDMVELAGNAFGLVMMAESDGLLGATLKRSPAELAQGEAIFAHPGVRSWLSYTPERQHRRAVALVAGVACVGSHPVLAPFLRPLGESGLHAHLHAVALPFRPLPRGRISLAETVARLFEAAPLAVLHLLRDDRELSGGGDSSFLRGAIWLGPLRDIRREQP
jgi:anti-anti-sigma factor